jgi:hypothetical protein
MAENEELRLEMEEYIKEHDIPHLFERLTASIMYDRPGAFNLEFFSPQFFEKCFLLQTM